MIGAIGAIVQLVVIAAIENPPKSPLELLCRLAQSALCAQLITYPILATFTRSRNAAIFGVMLLMAACLWGPLEFLIGLTTGWWLTDGIPSFVQLVGVPIAMATIILVSKKPQALFLTVL